MNPAISLAMWRFGVFPGVSVAPYILAQLFGSILGGVAARVVWGPTVAEPPVAYAVLQPGPGWSTLSLFAAETAGMAVIVLVVGLCLSVARLIRGRGTKTRTTPARSKTARLQSSLC
jgi:glycerol uptake facilitator-like aquaporin